MGIMENNYLVKYENKAYNTKSITDIITKTNKAL